MVAFGHTAVGVVVGLTSYQMFGANDPVLGLLTTGAVGIVSHYIADFVPHGHFFTSVKDYGKKVKWVILFDLFISVLVFVISSYLNYGLTLKTWYILFGIGGSQLPDVFDAFIYLGKIKKKGLAELEHSFHKAMHWHSPRTKGLDGLPLGWYDIWQVATVIFSLYLIFVLK